VVGGCGVDRDCSDVRELSLPLTDVRGSDRGIAVRNQRRPDSDLDLLVEFLPEAQVDLVDYAGLMLDLSRLLGRKVDLVSKNGLKPSIKTAVLEEARLLYAA
jgi:predicted nucleotidyltransferase